MKTVKKAILVLSILFCASHASSQQLNKDVGWSNVCVGLQLPSESEWAKFAKSFGNYQLHVGTYESNTMDGIIPKTTKSESVGFSAYRSNMPEVEIDHLRRQLSETSKVTGCMAFLVTKLKIGQGYQTVTERFPGTK